MSRAIVAGAGYQRVELEGTRLTAHGIRTRSWELSELAWVLMSDRSLPLLLSPNRAAATLHNRELLPKLRLLGIGPDGSTVKLSRALIEKASPEFHQRLIGALLAASDPHAMPHPSALARLADQRSPNGWFHRRVMWAPSWVARVALLISVVLAVVLVALRVHDALANDVDLIVFVAAVAIFLSPSAVIAAWVTWRARRQIKAGKWPYPVLRERYEHLGAFEPMRW